MAKAGSAGGRPAKGAAGEAETLSSIWPLIHDQMQEMARCKLRREGPGHALSAGDLVHEAYLRLAAQTGVRWTGPAHVRALAALAMRRILIDHARRAHCGKRGGGLSRPPLDPLAPVAPCDAERAGLFLALDEAMERLQSLNPRGARVVQCRFLDGMTEVETAAALRISVRTAKRDWAEARAWLYTQIYRGPEPALSRSRPRAGHWGRDAE